MGISVTPIPRLTPFATPDIGLAATAAAGDATSTIRSNATIVAFDASDPVVSTYGGSSAVGSADVSARRDHKHGLAASTTGITKGLVYVVNDGTHVAASAQNITSTAKTTTGTYLITWATDFGSANYIMLTTVDAGDTRVANVRNMAAGTVNVNVYASDSASTLEDSNFMVAAWGAQ